jgi:hypothetical protein|tara:strand:+ start:20547 stop:20753 length:207 start_codon:yes stop_codon:yes gene_type:complete
MNIEEQDFISNYEAVLSSEMMLIKQTQHGLQYSTHPGAARQLWQLQIVYEYMRDRLLATNLKNEKKLN